LARILAIGGAVTLFWLSCFALVMAALAAVLLFRSAAGKRLRLQGGNLYYGASVTADEAAKAGRFLDAKGYLKAGLLDARLHRDATTYHLQLIGSVDEPTDDQRAAAEVLAADFSDEVLSGADVLVQYCDPSLKPIAVIPHAGRLGKRIGMNAALLFYTDGVADDDAMRVATFLVAAGLFNDSSKVTQLNREGDGFDFRVAVNVDPLTPEMLDGQHKMAADLSKKVLGGRPVQVSYCKGLAATLRSDLARRGAGRDEESTRVTGRSYRAAVFVRPPDDDTGSCS
jgi:hypothetical protein